MEGVLYQISFITIIIIIIIIIIISISISIIIIINGTKFLILYRTLNHNANKFWWGM